MSSNLVRRQSLDIVELKVHVVKTLTFWQYLYTEIRMHSTRIVSVEHELAAKLKARMDAITFPLKMMAYD
jgi:regulator of PEP synthase PpsR (kinase-PPPase family)